MGASHACCPRAQGTKISTSEFEDCMGMAWVYFSRSCICEILLHFLLPAAEPARTGLEPYIWPISCIWLPKMDGPRG